jgi:chemotaxis signal transduction protein
LRNSLIPLLHLDLLLEASGREQDKHQFIIVCRSHTRQFGLLVDRITTMHTFDEHDVEWTIDAQLGGDSGYLSGLIKNESRLIGIISVERIAEKVLVPLQESA